ncbi:tetratricopeptide repeat protein [Azospirillum sp.]|uniref:O-linked N-acetylglucosamine transferase, SPINDLY family protein n=1 Tax=Azospirillum sp. TaxID=34012 RepID=UPI003D753FE7
MAVIGVADSLMQGGRSDLAVQIYRLWTQTNASDPLGCAIHYNLGVLLLQSADPAGASEALERSLQVNPDFHPARLSLGVATAGTGDVERACQHWMDVAGRLDAVNPTNLRYKKMAWRYLASYLEGLHRYPEAEAVLRQSIDLDPTQTEIVQHWLSMRQEQCIWPVAVPLEGVSREALLRTMLPLSLAAFTDDPILHLASAWSHTQTVAPPTARLAEERGRADAAPERLKVGYLSSDLRDHAVGSLLPEVFERHDRARVEVFAYYTGQPSGSLFSLRLKTAIEHWVDLAGMSDEAVAQRIAADGIDILIDLNGHTRDARTPVLAMRPAPVIVNWLGYPGTMGSPYHHYIIADDWIVPAGSEIYYSETVLRLPCYQPNDRKRAIAPPVRTRGDFGLPDDAMVYCCFNAVHKITRFTFERWMEILRRVPDSVLWLFEESAASSQRLRALAEQAGVSGERLVFAGKLPHDQHLARYALADLFLDTTPYGAHTTGSDALWSGLPVLTLSGRSFASRVCGSLVRAAGLPELVCTTPQAYVERAVALGQDRDGIRRLKETLAAQRATCTLFDMERLVASLEALYRRMWDDFAQGRLPVPDLGNLDLYLAAGLEEDPDQVELLAVDGYHERYRERLERRHRLQPVAPDTRLWRP